MFKKAIFLIILVNWSITVESAQVIFEPYLGFHTGSYNDGGKSHGASGFGMGGRIAYEEVGIMAGLELQLTILSSENSAGADIDIEQNQLGIWGGFIFPGLPLRSWMTLFPYDAAELRPGGELKGTGVKFGMGFDPIPLLSLNVEYKRSSYDEIEVSGVDLPTAEQNISTVFVSASFLFGGSL
jgi:hypothetical protein